MNDVKSYSSQHLYSLLQAEFPDIDDLVLRVNADVLAENRSAASVAERALSSKEQWQKNLLGAIDNTLRATGQGKLNPFLDEYLNGADLIRHYAVAAWDAEKIQAIAQRLAFGSTAHALGISPKELCPDDRTIGWIVNVLDEDEDSECYYEDKYWRGVALLCHFVLTTDNSSRIFNGEAGKFMAWIMDGNNFEAIAPFFIERDTINVDDLAGLVESSSSIPPSMRLGTL